MPRGALLRRDRAQRRARRRRGAASPSAGASSARTRGRWCAAWSGCTPRSPCPTRRSARPASCAASWARCCTCTWPRTAPTWRTRGGAATRARSSGCCALDALPAGSILAHGVHLSRGAGARRRARWAAGWCRTRAPTAATASATRRALRASARVALGTDGYPVGRRTRSGPRCWRRRAPHGDDLDAAARPRRARATRCWSPSGSAASAARRRGPDRWTSTAIRARGRARKRGGSGQRMAEPMTQPGFDDRDRGPRGLRPRRAAVPRRAHRAAHLRAARRARRASPDASARPSRGVDPDAAAPAQPVPRALVQRRRPHRAWRRCRSTSCCPRRSPASPRRSSWRSATASR